MFRTSRFADTVYWHGSGELQAPAKGRSKATSFSVLQTIKFQKNPRVRKILVRSTSGAGNGCANFMDTWKKCVLSAGKTMSVKFPFFGFFFFGGGGVPILFLWARGFF